jgi:predicted dehydrogenase
MSAIMNICEIFRAKPTPRGGEHQNLDMNTNEPIPRRQFIKQATQAAMATAAVSGPLAAFGQASSAPVAFALAGAAHIHTPNYIQILKQRRDIKVKYVWDHDAARATKAAVALDSHEVDDPKTIWEDAEVKAVVICSETDRHRDLVLAAAQAKKHVFVEKPMGIGSHDAYEMADALEKAGVLFNTGYMMRTEPSSRFLKQQVDEGAFGKITRVRGSTCHNGSLEHWFDTDWRWMADPKIAGVGGFGDLGTHSLDLLMWMFGDVGDITADIKSVTGNYGGCDESGEALLKFKNGITGTLAAGWVDLSNPESLMISGTEGYAQIQDGVLYFTSKKVAGADGKKPWTRLPDRLPKPMDQFVDAVTGQFVTTLVKPREAAARVSVMEAAYKAATQQIWVKPA